MAGCVLLLASSVVVDAFSAKSLFSRQQQHHHGRGVVTTTTTTNNFRNNNHHHGVLMMAGFPPPMGGAFPGPPGGAGGGPPPPPQQSQSYNANNPPGGQFSAPNSGNPPADGAPNPNNQRGGLGAIASGVSTPMDKYGNRRDNDRPRRPGGYDVGGGPRGGDRFGGDPNSSSVPGGLDPRYDDRRSSAGIGMQSSGAGMPPRGDDGDIGQPPRPGPENNYLRYEERDYGQYVTNLRQSASSRGAAPPPPGPGITAVPVQPSGRDSRYAELQDEVDRLRKENALLKSSCRDFMNNFNELSNRLFDVDESLKKVAKVFPSEDEMESLEWLLRR